MNTLSIPSSALDALIPIADPQNKRHGMSGIRIQSAQATATNGRILLLIGERDDSDTSTLLLTAKDCKGSKSLTSSDTLHVDAIDGNSARISGEKGQKAVEALCSDFPDVEHILQGKEKTDKAFVLDLVQLKKLVDALLKVAPRTGEKQAFARFSFLDSEQDLCVLTPLFIETKGNTPALGCIMPSASL